MPVEKTYLDKVEVKNLTNRPITLGDLVNVTIPARKTVDLLKQPRVTKEKINQSQHLQIALKNKWIKITRTKRKNRTNDEKKASVAWEEDVLDINLGNLQDKDLLQYDGDSNAWKNTPVSEIDINLNSVSVSENYDMTATDDLILVDASSGIVTITLLPIENIQGKEVSVKKIDPSSNVVVVEGSNFETIDDELNQHISSYDTIKMAAVTNGWVII